ncbi:hypothetical protein [Flavobacterium sp. ACAM 123]|jgi:hypothetical protein|uniref:hypothetical protein n=1 Tax=Flavobacterium sp. ACAM 123 TaxID=1189620 RepID=UPI0002D8A17B|nr:hypothetical protein [Flavobacterium sp. ACAM 123]
MKRLKTITGIALMAILGLTSCQSEVDDVQGENPNTNAANSTTANNLKRTSMYDGSFDDFIDGASCSSILLPATAIVNGTRVTLFSQLDYQQAITILGRFNNDQDSVVLQFPLRVKTSNYTEVMANNQTEYNAILNTCSQAEASGQGAITSLNINFPITILTYNVSLQQTGSVVITSEKQLFTYISNVSSTELFSVNYPITVTLAGGTDATVNSDAELQSNINASLATQATITQAEQNAKKLETILVNGMFKVQSFVTAGTDSANNYKDNTVDFANDWTMKASTALVNTATGTYTVSSEADVFLKLNFTGFTSFSLLNNTWKVVSYSTSSITLQSKTNAAVTLVLGQI